MRGSGHSQNDAFGIGRGAPTCTQRVGVVGGVRRGGARAGLLSPPRSKCARAGSGAVSCLRLPRGVGAQEQAMVQCTTSPVAGPERQAARGPDPGQRLPRRIGPLQTCAGPPPAPRRWRLRNPPDRRPASSSSFQPSTAGAT
eukprot:scaffold2462_cov402-Prasinococcus_capsulatus_cf.AAC.2